MLNMFLKNKKNRNKNTLIVAMGIYANNQVDIVYEACKSCYGKEVANVDRTTKLNYIKSRIEHGHESILEHTNIIIGVDMSHDSVGHLYPVLASCKYLNVSLKENNVGVCALIGGSIRGFKHLFKTIDDLSNPIIGKIKECLYEMSYKEFFVDFIEAGIMEEEKFLHEPITLIYPADSYKISYREEQNMIKVINLDPIMKILTTVNELYENLYQVNDILDLCSTTVLFKNMSRTATHQLVRHRNGITQESQRYTNYTEAGFVSPDTIKDEYKDKKYEVELFGTTKNLTMSELGAELMKVYASLLGSKVAKEDARAFLPSNVACGKLYMTFNFRNLIKFLELRTDTAAQAEIRSYAINLEWIFKDTLKDNDADLGDIYKYLIPKYMLTEVDNDYSAIDEVISEEESETDGTV